MNTLYDQTTAATIKKRVSSLTSTSQRVWGKMNPAKAMAHCAGALEWATDTTPHPPRIFIGYLFAWLAKKPMFGSDKPMGRGAPTSPHLIITDDRDLAAEQRRVNALIDRFVAGGRNGVTKGAHTFFGPLTADEWGVLMYKHLDHHLRQFGV